MSYVLKTLILVKQEVFASSKSQLKRKPIKVSSFFFIKGFRIMINYEKNESYTVLVLGESFSKFEVNLTVKEKETIEEFIKTLNENVPSYDGLSIEFIKIGENSYF